jgi:predicted nucleic acid-binding protein
MSNEVFLDTNILLYLSNRRSVFYSTALSAVRKLEMRGDSLCLSAQILIEFWSRATKPTTSGGLGYTPEKARLAVEKTLEAFELKPDDPRIFSVWLGLVFDSGVSGSKVHDARIAATMIVHQIPRILTFNLKDFDRFAGVESLDPASL